MPISEPDKIISFQKTADFENESFFIPDYQRGYRWTAREIEDLLKDLLTFKKYHPEDSYSMQPIVVKKRADAKWEIIDGQQRVTSILLILQALDVYDYYAIEYEVLPNSTEHIAKICNSPVDDINLWHMNNAYQAACKWIELNIDKERRDDFLCFVKNNLKFLWYRSDLVDGDKVSGEIIFQRLNIGKIELTQSELIKALFLSDDVYANEPVNRKQEIASQWDEFEAMLQNDEFWFFLSDKQGSDAPNRIEFLLKNLILLHGNQYFKNVDFNAMDSKDWLFRTFYEVYQSEKNLLLKIWDKAIDFMDITRLWYEDVTLYHLIGFRIIEGEKIENLIREWNDSTVPSFLAELSKGIVKRNPLNISKVYGYKNKDGKWIDRKGEAKNLLLLANILQVLRQNLTHEKNTDYAQGIFYKFPFHLFKKQVKGKGRGWDVEHIASATDNDLESTKDQQDWICCAYMALQSDKRSLFKESLDEKTNLNNSLSYFFSSSNNEESIVNFDIIYKVLSEFLELNNDSIMSQEEKNQISNFALLDYTTNRIYKNAIFPTKRQHVRNKEIGKLKRIVWDKDDFKEITEDAVSAFGPPCTKDVFMKTYSNIVGDSLRWSNSDANDYAKYLEELFQWFLEWTSNEK